MSIYLGYSLQPVTCAIFVIEIHSPSGCCRSWGGGGAKIKHSLRAMRRDSFLSEIVTERVCLIWQERKFEAYSSFQLHLGSHFQGFVYCDGLVVIPLQHFTVPLHWLWRASWLESLSKCASTDQLVLSIWQQVEQQIGSKWSAHHINM